MNWEVEEARGGGAGELFADFERGYALGQVCTIDYIERLTKQTGKRGCVRDR